MCHRVILAVGLSVLLLSSCTPKKIPHLVFPHNWQRAIDQATYHGRLRQDNGQYAATVSFMVYSSDTIEGEYFYGTHNRIRGTLKQCQADSRGRLLCRWQSGMGQGLAEFFFTDDYNALEGIWGGKRTKLRNYFSGRKKLVNLNNRN